MCQWTSEEFCNPLHHFVIQICLFLYVPSDQPLWREGKAGLGCLCVHLTHLTSNIPLGKTVEGVPASGGRERSLLDYQYFFIGSTGRYLLLYKYGGCHDAGYFTLDLQRFQFEGVNISTRCRLYSRIQQLPTIVVIYADSIKWQTFCCILVISQLS